MSGSNFSSLKMPVLFAGHGSPMNAVDKTVFGDLLSALGPTLPKPQAILMISAHWQTQGTQLVGSAHPETIHDFYGFPQQLFDVKYAAPGAPVLAKRIQSLIPEVKVVRSWGLDHGAWSVLIHLFPQANIPVLQMSLDENLSLQEHFALAHRLKALRDEGVMIIGSGNIVHNLRAAKWSVGAEPNAAYDWSLGFDQNIKQALEQRDPQKLLEFEKLWPEQAKMAVPTLEHYLPLIYAYGVTDEADALSFPIEGFQLASISMRTALWAA
jgi:4,5-DOPA dioxygenase extradiol